MKLKNLLLLSAVLMFAACAEQAPKGYTITGTAEGTTDGDTVFLCEMQGYFEMNPLDTAYVKDGKFEFKGHCEGAEIRFLIPTHEGEWMGMEMFILENADIKATLMKGEGNSKIEAGPNGKLYEEFQEGMNKFAEQANAPWDILNDSTKSEAEQQAAQAIMDSLEKVQIAYTKKFIIDHVPSAISDMIFTHYREYFSESDKEEILKLFGEKQPEYPGYKAIMAAHEAQEATAIGQKYIDLEMPAPDGKNVKVSDYVGKNQYVLVDFWASWCGPCRAEMPNVVEAYTKYHDKGLEVIGVSFDNDKDAWVKAIEKLQMPWPQMSDLKGWESAAAAAYNIQAIPANVLIDKEGKIVEKNLRGEELLSKMAELLP
ncbi:MAG: AhpC/TSA family protein [Bacteroidaceae bacterium]|nr:AhpC/TSA family protein [Bacteroidaceae bacterium]